MTAAEITSLAQSNNFSMWNELLVSVGSGCYPLGAMINHACTPNCVITYDLVSKRYAYSCVVERHAKQPMLLSGLQADIPVHPRDQGGRGGGALVH